MTILQNNLVSIDTTVPTLSIGQIQISADRRSTKAAAIPESERIRRCVLPANHWGELSGAINSTPNQSLTDLLRTALVDIAGNYLRSVLNESPMQTNIPLADFTVPALLAFNSSSAAGRGSITFTREQVEAWLTTSATLASFKVKHASNPKLPILLPLFNTRFATLAAKNHGIKTSADCDKLVALIDPADLEGDDDNASLVTELMGRLDHIRKALAAKEAEETVSMDDL